MSRPTSVHAAIAAHRFGLGEPSADGLRDDPQAWLLAQIGPADSPRGDGLLSTAHALDLVAAERAIRQQALAAQPSASAAAAGAATAAAADSQLMRKRTAARSCLIPLGGRTTYVVGLGALSGHYREAIVADVRCRLVTATETQRPFAERLHLFWCNHFTVSLAKGATRGLVGAFERDAIRPNIASSFEALLLAATTHPAMLRYLDNVYSAGPNSRIVARAARRAEAIGEGPRVTGLNENLAREVLELHTLGAESARDVPAAAGGYTQADVTAFARVLTGWRITPRITPRGSDSAEAFDLAWHEPGRKTGLGRQYAEGPDALRQVLHDLALHPATARFIATKLARHFVADNPPAALVDRLAATYIRRDGALSEVYRELVRSPEAWSPTAAKLKTPEELDVSASRTPGLGARLFERGDAGGIAALGQRVHAAPSPAGWSDRAEDWLGPDAVWKRVEWASRIADRAGRGIDARALAQQSFGDRLADSTRQQIDRAADGTQALALLLMSPDFQRR